MTKRDLNHGDHAAIAAVTALLSEGGSQGTNEPRERRGKTITIPVPVVAFVSLIVILSLIIAILVVDKAKAESATATIAAEYERGRADGAVEQLRGVKTQCAAERERLKGEIALRDQKLAEADEFRADMLATLEAMDELSMIALQKEDVLGAAINLEWGNRLAAHGLGNPEERRAWFDARVMELIPLIREQREGTAHVSPE